MKNDKRAHRVEVFSEDYKRDFIICLSYDLDESGTFRTFEYHKLMFAIPNKRFQVPSGRTTTFEEELHLFKFATANGSNVGTLEDRIQEQIESAYDQAVRVKVSELVLDEDEKA